jgi:hypothetical protein
MENNSKPELGIKPINYWLIGISLILLGSSIFLNISHTVITSESVVLTFVGILATFIVVGNYYQVIQIKNEANNQIKELEIKTQKKLDALDKLLIEFKNTSKKIEEIEKRTIINSAEAYRLFGNFTADRENFHASTGHYLHSLLLYKEACHVLKPTILNGILDTILINLKPENWNEDDADCDYDNLIKRVKLLPDTYAQKQVIIDLLEKYKEEEKNNK